jgi:ribosomal protein S13
MSKQLEKALEAAESARSSEARSIRSVDRTVKDLQSQVERREKLAASLEEDLNRQRDRVGDLLKSIDDLQTQVSEKELLARRTDRELREEKEKSLKLEREIEGWKGLRFERGSVRGSVSVPSSQIGSIRGRSAREGSVPLLRGASPAPSSIGALTTNGFGSLADKQPSVEPESSLLDVSGAGSSTTSVAVPTRALRRVSHTKGFL